MTSDTPARTEPREPKEAQDAHSGTGHARLQPGHRLRMLLGAKTVAAPGAFNALVSLAARQAGFEACYVSGGASTVAAGVPDIGLLSLPDFCRLIREIHAASGLPVLADADTGFGEEEMVRRTVVDYSHAGAAGLHLEDQVFPKRCGHLDGKACVPTAHMVEKVSWAARAAADLGNGFMICARTDARHVEGFDAAVSRAAKYVAAGADMIFPEGLTSEAEFEGFAKDLRSRVGTGVFLLANMTEYGKTPMIPLSRFEALGYNMVIYPVSMLRVAMGAVTRALVGLRETGTLAGELDGMLTRDELYELVGYRPSEPWCYPAQPGIAVKPGPR